MFMSLDFLYVPSANVEVETRYFTEVLGGELEFSVKAMATRVAGIRLGAGPLLLLAGHLKGDTPILIYRVGDLNSTMSEMEGHGWQPTEAFEIPHGPCCVFTAEGGMRLGLYELERPEAFAHFAGRVDP
jgi:hypothetical protein